MDTSSYYIHVLAVDDRVLAVHRTNTYHFIIGTIAQVTEVIFAAVLKVKNICPLTSIFRASLNPTFSPIEVVAQPTDPMLPTDRSSQAVIVVPIIERGCLERTTTATCLIPPLHDDGPLCWDGEEPGADGIVFVGGIAADCWVVVIACDPVVSAAIVLIEESEIDC